MYEMVYPTDISENYSSSGMLTILIKVQTISILSNRFAGKLTSIIYKWIRYRISKIAYIFKHTTKTKLRKATTATRNQYFDKHSDCRSSDDGQLQLLRYPTGVVNCSSGTQRSHWLEKLCYEKHTSFSIF